MKSGLETPQKKSEMLKMSKQQVKFVDLQTQYQEIKTEIEEAIQSVLNSSQYISGPYVEEFEENFAKAHEAKYCVSSSSGTSALHLALWAHGITQDDEVIIPTNTFIATAEAVSLCGATPVFIDCDQNTSLISVEAIEKAITPQTKAIIPVHLFGQSANMGEILAIAEKNNLIVIEDSAQAHLAKYQNHFVGTLGSCGCFSFYPGKNLGAYGEGGAVLTNDLALYKKMKTLRDHGSEKRYVHKYVGHNYRMHGLQGAILNVKLLYLAEWTKKRQAFAKKYCERLKNCKTITLPTILDDCFHVFHLFVIQTENRDALMHYLNDKGIETGIHYPIPCHKQECYTQENSITMACPNAEAISQKILSLPMHPQLTEEQITYVTQTILDFKRSTQ